ncbi:hypothetical protein B4U79_07582 [Dinothrombium tinctorium]|uniref:separase n=1 Tax=Dinothrombium tinctorium TaxID=1965070 RepID=A0A3S3PYZ4_9ACAR|nr:hypothetical protein B4U79_13855 [Dinothrombium tinctorium]RWS10735.1 hypothetical protein B4U79_07582 [Dinothrombium tinctorium]
MAINSWEEAISFQKNIDSNLLVKLNIAYNLIASFYAFECYGFVKYQLKAAKLLLDLCPFLIDQREVQLHAYYLIIKVHLENGLLNKAKWYLHKAESLAQKLKNQSYESMLILLAKYEIALYSGNGEEYAEELNKFIQSDYLQKMTLNRYYLKGLALFLASQYPSTVYKFSQTFQEFLEPIQIAICILKRWHRACFPSSDQKKREDNNESDPIWYRFAVCNFALKAYKSAITFYVNVGILHDLAFVHNGLLKIGRRNCFIRWIIYLLTSAAEIDSICDKRKSSLEKLNACSLLFTKYSTYSSCQMPPSETDESLLKSWSGFPRDELDSDINIIMPSPPRFSSFTADECAHDAKLTLLDLKQLLLKRGNTDSPNSENEYDDVFVKSETLNEIGDDDFIMNVFYQHQLYLNFTVFQDVSKENIVSKLENMQTKLLQKVCEIYLKNICDIFSIEKKDIHISLGCLFGLILELKVCNYLVGSYLAHENFDFAITLCEKILPKINLFPFGIEMKTLIANLLVKYVDAKFQSLKQQSSVLEYDVTAMDELCKNGDFYTCKTPSPKAKTKTLVPKAPKGKVEYKMEEFKDYFDKFSKAVADQNKTAAKSKSKTNSKSRFTSKLESMKLSESSEHSNSLDDISRLDAILSSKKSASKRRALRSYSQAPIKTIVKTRSKTVTELTVENVNNENKVPNMTPTKKKKKNNLKTPLSLLTFEFNPEFDTDLKAMESFLNELPSSWRICQLHAVSNKTPIPDLYISRYQKGKNPLILKIKGNSAKFTKDFMSEFYEIIELSNASIANKEVKTFWRVRIALDNRFKLLMQSVDEKWFGPMKGIFMGEVEDEEFREMCLLLKNKIVNSMNGIEVRDGALLDLFVESFALLSSEEFQAAMSLVFGVNEISKSCYEECEAIFHKFHPLDEKTAIFEKIKTAPLALIVNKPLISFPFESLPTIVTLKQEVFRIPSVRFLSTLYTTFKSQASFSKGIDAKSVYYLLNPSNNLAKTENHFKEKFKKQDGWQGVIGSPPEMQDLKFGLENKDLYIYFGHGAGLNYYRSIPDSLEGASIKCSSLVIGCCSGKLFCDGSEAEPYGIPFRFIMNGSPCYLGILWDVTDRDIDRFADKLLSEWLPNWDASNSCKTESLCRAVLRSRNTCKLTYLIGAAPVVYGLPISVMKL